MFLCSKFKHWWIGANWIMWLHESAVFLLDICGFSLFFVCSKCFIDMVLCLSKTEIRSGLSTWLPEVLTFWKKKIVTVDKTWVFQNAVVSSGIVWSLQSWRKCVIHYEFIPLNKQLTKHSVSKFWSTYDSTFIETPNLWVCRWSLHMILHLLTQLSVKWFFISLVHPL
jgi:hypothetical protein